MSLYILKPGFLSLLQDYGRQGYKHIGATVGGPMDEVAFLWNNRLLNNQQNDTQIEITMGLFSCKFLQSTMIAISGAPMAATINNKPIKPWKSYKVNSGDILTYQTAQKGLYSYLSVKGGFKVDKTLGSSSAVLRDNLGGLNKRGKPIQKQDIIDFDRSCHEPTKKVLDMYIPNYPNANRIGVILGAQYKDFSKEAHHIFFSGPYSVTSKINRIGFRLQGKEIICKHSNMVSEPVTLGAIQIPSDGQPIIMMRDHQTIGGYPKIGTISRLDLSKLAQSPVGTTIYFYQKPLKQAIKELNIFRTFFR